MNTNKMSVVVTNNRRFGDIVSKAYFFLILILLPLYMDGAFYTALIDAKGHIYWVISALVLVGMVGYYAHGYFSGEYQWQFHFKRWSLLDWSILAVAGCVFISFILSDDLSSCFRGDHGFYVGTYMILSSIIFYFFASRNLIADYSLWGLVMMFNELVFLWIFLNACSVDILNMHAHIDQNQYFHYLSCLGQMDSISAYLCLILPVGIVFYVNAQKKDEKNLYARFCILGLLALFCIQTDGVFIGFAFCGLFLFPYLIGNKERLVRTLHIGVMAGADLTLLKILFLVIPDRIKQDDGVSNFLIDHWMGPVIMIFCLLLIWFMQKNERIKESLLKKIGIVSAVLIALVIVGYAVFSVITFAPRWGNGRGAIWAGSVKVYADYSFVEKLFGLGMEMIVEPLSEATGWSVGVANCHNNILECLLCLGMVGLLAYLFAWFALVREYVKGNRAKWSVERIAYFMALIAYFGQSIVGNPYSLSFPIMFLILALYRNAAWREE